MTRPARWSRRSPAPDEAPEAPATLVADNDPDIPLVSDDAPAAGGADLPSETVADADTHTEVVDELVDEDEVDDGVEVEERLTFWERRRLRNEEHRRNTPVWKERLVPRSVLGMAIVLVAFALGAATSGVSLYAYYQYRLDRENEFQKDYAAQFGGLFDDARKTIEADRNNARADIQRELAPLRANRADGEALIALSKQVDPSVWFVQTTDLAGQPSVGSAFVVWSDGSRSLLVTSFTTINAASHQPAPAITLRKGNETVAAQLWTWDDEKDLALLVVSRANMPKLEFQPQNALPKLGERVFTVSGLGGSGVAIAQGFVADTSAAGIQHDSPVGTAFQGGPLLNSEGKVVGVASRTYAPLGYRSEGVTFAVLPPGVCAKLLRCPGPEPVGQINPPA